MYARVATWEGGDPDKVREMAEGMKQESGPPEGVPSTGFLMLQDPDSQRVLAIGLFETEADYEQGDATLNEMNPPIPGAMGKRVSVERWEVAADLRPS
jgi:hypothetical protein